MYGETITVIGEDYETPDGRVVENTRKQYIDNCVVHPVGQSETEDVDVWDGDTRELRVLAPAGTAIENGQRVEFRGVEYVTKYTSFDYAPIRRPVIARHRVGVVFNIVREEA